MSMTPSWKPTMGPVVVTTQPSRQYVTPLPPSSMSSRNRPGNVSPSILARGSMTSLTGRMRVDVPGSAMSKETSLMRLSSSIHSFISSGSTMSLSPSIRAGLPNSMFLMATFLSSSTMHTSFSLLQFLKNTLEQFTIDETQVGEQRFVVLFAHRRILFFLRKTVFDDLEAGQIEFSP